MDRSLSGKLAGREPSLSTLCVLRGDLLCVALRSKTFAAYGQENPLPRSSLKTLRRSAQRAKGVLHSRHGLGESLPVHVKSKARQWQPLPNWCRSTEPSGPAAQAGVASGQGPGRRKLSRISRSWPAAWDCTRCASRRSVPTSASAGTTAPPLSCCWATSVPGAADFAPCPKASPARSSGTNRAASPKPSPRSG